MEKPSMKRKRKFATRTKSWIFNYFTKPFYDNSWKEQESKKFVKPQKFQIMEKSSTLYIIFSLKEGTFLRKDWLKIEKKSPNVMVLTKRLWH